MKKFGARFSLLAILIAVALGGIQAASAADQTYALTRTIKVGGDGGWDYVTVDAAGKLLYVTRSTHTDSGGDAKQRKLSSACADPGNQITCAVGARG